MSQGWNENMSPRRQRWSYLEPHSPGPIRSIRATQPPLPPPPPKEKGANLFALIGFALLVIDLALVGLVCWERFTTIQYFSSQVDAELIEITPTVFFECQVRFEVSHEFKSGHYATINVRVEKGPGTVVWQQEFNLNSPGTLVETKYDSAWFIFEPGTYYVTIDTSAPQGATQIVAERMGTFTTFGQLYFLGLFPGLALAGLLLLVYSDDPNGFFPALKKDFTRDWKTSLKNIAVIIGGWILLIVLLAATLAFFRSIVGLIGVILVLSIVGLAYEGLKRAGGWVLGTATGRRSS